MPKKKQLKKSKIKRFNQKKFLKDLWTLWSMYIRSKDADHRGYVSCFTCGFTAHWKEMDAGHYWHSVLDFDERNINVQCRACNRYKGGNLQNYSLALIRKHGSNVLDELAAARKEYQKTYRYDIIKLKALYEELKKKYGLGKTI